MDVAARLETVEAENEMLREQISRLEALLGVGFTVPLEFCLTSKEAATFGILMQREIATKEMVMWTLYGGLGKNDVEPKIVDVFICKIRKKLKAFAIEIKTQWGAGYYLDKQSKQRVTDMMNMRNAA